MVFKRSLSLPGPNPNPSTSKKDKDEDGCHVRSSSLPCRSHPHFSQLVKEVRSLRSWRLSERSSGSPSPSWLRGGLSRLELLHAALDELLQLPQVQDSLRRRRSSVWSETLLDDFLRLADAYDCFRHALVSLQQLQSAAQAAARRRDDAKFGSHARSHRKSEKELARLVAMLRDMGRTTEPVQATSDAGEGAAELAVVLREVKTTIASASAFVFSGLAALSSSSFSAAPSSSPCGSSSSSSSSSWAVLKKRLTSSSRSRSKRSEEEWEVMLEVLKTLERCIVGLESGSDNVFRCLINTRVALLNIMAS